MGFGAAVRLHAQLLPPALLALLLTGCPRGAPPHRPNILLVSIDSLRADTADGIGGTLPTGPRLRGLAGESAVFTRASSAAPWTTPSMMSVLTGLYPWSHHVRDHNWTLAPQIPLLSERLKALGYATGAVVPSATLREEFGFDRGFDFFDNGRYGHDVVTSPPMTGQALSWLAEHRAKDSSRPFFLWVHYWDPHYNYIPPAPFDASFPSGWTPAPGARYDMTALKNREGALRPEETAWLRSQYEGELLYTDRFLGDLLDWIAQNGAGDDTLVVLLGDHGEAFQEHGWLTHTMRVHEEMIHVPLAIRWPGHARAGARLDEPVSLASVTPTILEAIGAAGPADAAAFDAPSLWPRVSAGGTAPAAGPIVSETIRMASLSSLREGSWKYILDMDGCGGQLFDLDADPGETRDLAGAKPDVAAAMRGRLMAFYRDSPHAKAFPAVAMPPLDDANDALLRSLGYIGAAPVDRFGDAVTFSGKTDPLHCP